MKVKARLLCRNGMDQGAIQIVAYYKNQQKEVSIGRKIPKSAWDPNRGIVKGPEHEMLNVRIRNVIRDISAAIDEKIAKKEDVELDIIFQEVLSPAPKPAVKEPGPDITLVKFIEDFISENPDKIHQSSMNGYRSLLKTILEFESKNVLLKDVNIEYVNKLYDFLQKKGLKASTIQTKFKKFKKIMNTAIARNLTEEYPFGKGKLTVPGNKIIRRKYLESKEIEKILSHAPRNETERKVLRIIKFNLHVGLRIGDIFTLRKEDIVIYNHPVKGQVFKLSKTTRKTETDIEIMLTKQARQQIMEEGFEELQNHDLLFRWLDDSSFTDSFTLYKAISSKTALFNKVLSNICKAVGVKHISSHSLRHTFCTTLLSKGVPITSISKMVGHADVSTTMIYSQIVQETVDDAISILDE